ncbi:MAG: MOSC domain-containing protein [Rubellimicrobium sp.]|nr:MOSC domain-containing protein [Rubellimicrobium sp.]
MTRFTVAALHIGRARPFGPSGELSAIDKLPVAGPVMAGASGLAGDEQGDPHRHGGPDKALHAYARAQYPLWARDLPQIAERFHPGAFGENLVVDGATEADVCLGDRWQVGGALLEVSQSRQPCWKLNHRFGLPDMARRVQDSGRTGWYFRVIGPGPIGAGDEAWLRARPFGDWPLTRVGDVLYRDTLDRGALAALAAIPGLPASWQRLAANRLARGEVEDWSARLEPPPAGREGGG